MIVLLIGAAGGLGATARFLIDSLIRSRLAPTFPLGTLIINLTGSFLLGLLLGLGTSMITAQWQLVLGTGFLGGYTTFSTASVETVRLIQERRHLAAAINGVGKLVACVGAAALGLALGSGLR
jgi:CrcB protein